ncbi:MAG: DNA-binding protein [Chloroflexota bacterium]
MSLDSLSSRERQIALFERYRTLLTDHQQQVLDLYLRRDWSLSEVAAHQATSRAAVHDLVRRSAQVMEGYEQRLGLLREEQRRRGQAAALSRELAGLRRRLARAESGLERIR